MPHPEPVNTEAIPSTSTEQKPSSTVETPNKRKHSHSTQHILTTKTTKTPSSAYLHLELSSVPHRPIHLDDITVRSHLTSALTQFLGLMGASIAIDILKVEGNRAWIRVPREDLSAVVAGCGAWVGGSEREGRVGWKVRRSGCWLGSLVGRQGVEGIWEG